MREITIRSIVLGILVTAALAAANAYLGLKAGMTVSASIPAAVISMGILAALGRGKGTNIFENNMVQTAASAGESLAAGVIFTVPALILMGHWETFSYWEVALIAGLGGTLGILFCIPLRRAFIVDSKELTFPEGVATAEVLKEGEKGGKGAKVIAVGAGLGGLFKFLQSGLGAWGEALEGAKLLGGKWVAYLGTNLSAAILGVGYIVGRNIGILVFLGGAISWFVALPMYASLHLGEIIGDETIQDLLAKDPVGGSYAIWSKKIRYLGVGAMAVGGLYALFKVFGPVVDGIRSGMEVYKKMGAGQKDLPREERNIPMPWVLWGIAALVVPIFFYYNGVLENMTVAIAMSVVMVLAGFLFSSVAGYMGGLVGSSNNPISGITIATLLFTSFVLLAMMGKGGLAPAAAILVGAVVACAASIGSDVLQDLKCGNLVNATPWKQEVMEILGVAVAAFVIAPVLNLLHAGYGIGTDAHLSSDLQGNALPAPQAGLMASVAEGILGDAGSLPWDLVGIGALLAVGIILWDRWLEKSGSTFRAPVLAVAVGIYLPIELAVPIFAGGMLRHALHAPKVAGDEERGDSKRGILVASGLITGEALMGILLAGAIVWNWNLPTLELGAWGPWVGFAAMVGIAWHLAMTALRQPPSR
ncbi:oligopeptide transporter, OPT family [bacterium]|nr:oligopeptide transporter, OPT family [bacterium]